MAREQMVSSALFCQYGHDVNGCDIIRKILRMESVFMMNTNKKDIVKMERIPGDLDIRPSLYA